MIIRDISFGFEVEEKFLSLKLSSQRLINKENLSMSLRNSDFVVRFGGDKFLVVLSQTEKRVRVVKDRILKNLGV